MGRPIVAADHGASRELVVTGETGWLVPPDDPAALAAALETAIALAAPARAIRWVRERFSKQVMCAATLDAYRELLEEALVGDEAAA